MLHKKVKDSFCMSGDADRGGERQAKYREGRRPSWLSVVILCLVWLCERAAYTVQQMRNPIDLDIDKIDLYSKECRRQDENRINIPKENDAETFSAELRGIEANSTAGDHCSTRVQLNQSRCMSELVLLTGSKTITSKHRQV